MPETSTPKAIARLFSWLRQGLHAGITAAPGGVTAQDGHMAVPIRLRVNNTSPPSMRPCGPVIRCRDLFLSRHRHSPCDGPARTRDAAEGG